jgi:exopolysaccharide biosynthesis protein/GH25 family lysozyme M1 (1,4-beta-N-acetylmuramidase)
MLNKLVVDIARYTAGIDPLPLHEGSVQLVILKADNLFATNGKILVNSGMPIAAYHWIDPTKDAAQQVTQTLDLIKQSGLPVLAIFPDLEQYWGKWDEWYKAIQGTLSWSMVSRLGGDKISSHAKQVFEGFKAAGYKTIGYTRASFVKDYAPQASAWMPDYQWWLAHYISIPNQTLTWAELKTNILPKVNFAPALPANLTAAHVVGHQFTGDKLSLPGLYGDVERKKFSAADVSLFDEQFLKGLGIGTGTGNIEDIPLTPLVVNGQYEAVVTAVALNVRSGPGIEYPRLYTLAGGAKVELTASNKGWAKIKSYRDEWCSEEFLKIIIATPDDDQPDNNEQPVDDGAFNVNYSGVTYQTLRRANTSCHVLLIDPRGKRFQVTPFKGYRTVTQAAQETRAQIVVNGDGWGIGGRAPNSIAASDGNFYQRSQMEYRPWMNISKDNKFTFAWRNPENLYNAVSGDRFLIQNGKYNEAIVNVSKAPRTAVGVTRDGKMILIVCDGRTAESPGLTFRDLSAIMLEQGTVTAINLDGGGSTAMWLKDRIVNIPIDNGVKGKERLVVNHLCVYIT